MEKINDIFIFQNLTVALLKIWPKPGHFSQFRNPGHIYYDADVSGWGAVICLRCFLWGCCTPKKTLESESILLLYFCRPPRIRSKRTPESHTHIDRFWDEKNNLLIMLKKKKELDWNKQLHETGFYTFLAALIKKQVHWNKIRPAIMWLHTCTNITVFAYLLTAYIFYFFYGCVCESTWVQLHI